MDERHCLEVLRAHNEWRRYKGDDDGAPEMLPPKLVGQAIDHAIATIERERWRPIAEAPKDEIVLVTDGRRTWAGVWNGEDPSWRWALADVGCLLGGEEPNGLSEHYAKKWRPLPDPQPDGQEG